MNDALLLDGPGLRFLWQSTAWLAAGLAASFVLRRRPARAHAALVVALAGLFVTPLANLAVSRLECGLLAAPPVPSSDVLPRKIAPAELLSDPVAIASLVPNEPPPMTLDVTDVEPASAPLAQPRGVSSPFRIRLPGALSVVWMLTSAALAVRLGLATWRARRLVAGKGPVTADHLRQCLSEAAAQIDRRITPVLGTADVRAPIVWCWGRAPTVLVPMDAETSGAGIDWVGVFRHELAHWKRKDHLTGLLAQAAVVLLPWHPLCWWGARRLHELSEQSCDQWAVADGRSPLDFAESLLSLHPENRCRAALAAVSSRRLLAVRVSRLLQFEPGDPRLGRTWTAAVVGLCFLTAAALALAQNGPAQSVAKAIDGTEADAELHVIGIYGPKDVVGKSGRVDVTVRATAKPIVLVLSSYNSVDWHIKPAVGARIKEVIVSGYRAQEITGLPDDVPVANRSYMPVDRSRPMEGWFYAFQWDTIEYRRMVETLNNRTGLLVTTAQLEYSGTSFVVDGKKGRNYAQLEHKPRRVLPKEPSPEELLAASADAELHIVSTYESANGNGAPFDVEVRPTGKPIVLVMSSHNSVLWNVKVLPQAQLKAVIISGYDEQEFEGIPDGVPIVSRTYFPAQNRDYFQAHTWNTIEYRRMVEKLNEMTGLLVSTAQVDSSRFSYVVDGIRGREYAQTERKPRCVFPTAPTPAELLAASADADLHVVSVYSPSDGNGAPVDVEVRATGKPIVLVLSSYFSALWNLKIAPGARVKAIVIGGYDEQEFEGIPDGVPIVSRFYFPTRQPGWFFAYERDSKEYRGMLEALNEMTGRLVSTAQLEYAGTSFVVDGTKGREQAQTEKAVATAQAGDDGKRPAEKVVENVPADVADIPSQDLQAAGDADKRYFLIGPRPNTEPPAAGYGLVVIMPGGDGSADFHPFVKRIYKNTLPNGYLAVQPVAVRWSPEQKIVWPTKTNPVAKMKFSTEEFVEAVIRHTGKTHKLDRSKIFSLSWSSSGPAAYALSLENKSPVTGSYIAMSVFNPKFLPPLDKAKGHAYYLHHSPEDRVCPFRMAAQAETDLTKNGAKVRLETYTGGHGWQGDVFSDIRQGIEWLEKNHAPADGP